MSINENIATLTGSLKFLVELSGLRRMQSMLHQVERQMSSLGKQAEGLQKKLNLKFGVTGNGTSAEKLKADASVRKSLDRELVTEMKLSKLRRQQFTTQIAEQKLVSAGTRQEAFLQSASLKDQMQRAVLASKQHAAEQAGLKTALGKARLQATSEQSRIREARYADILQKRQAQTVRLQQQAAMHQTRLQKAETALSNARASGIRQTQRYRDSRVAAAAREARAQMTQDRAAKRFDMSADRYQTWKARQQEPQGLGLSGLSVGLGVAGAALYGLTAAIGALGERVKQRQADASVAEQLNTALESAGGKNKENQKFARDQFIDTSNKYGQEISVDTAKSYALFVQGQLALGKSLTQATKMFEDQSATFRAAALDKEAQKRAAYQLNQIRAKGRPEGSDVNDLFDAVGGVVAVSIRQAAATRLNFKGNISEQAGWFKQAVTDGKIRAADFDQGLTNFLKANQDILAKQMNSIAAAQQRAENQSYLNDNAINSSAELKGVILERIQAERELNQAMQPFKETLASFDLGLTKLSTVLLRLTAGRNADGTEKSEQQKVQDRMTTNDIAVDTNMVGVGDYSTINGETQHQGGLIGNLYNKLFGVKDYRKGGEANKVRAWEPNTLGMQFQPLDLSKLKLDFDVGELAERIGEYQRFRPDTLEPITSRDMMRTSGSSVEYPVQQITTTNEHVTNNNNTITPTITVNVNTIGGDEALGKVVGDEVDARMQRMLRETQANQKEVY